MSTEIKRSSGDSIPLAGRYSFVFVCTFVVSRLLQFYVLSDSLSSFLLGRPTMPPRHWNRGMWGGNRLGIGQVQGEQLLCNWSRGRWHLLLSHWAAPVLTRGMKDFSWYEYSMYWHCQYYWTASCGVPKTVLYAEIESFSSSIFRTFQKRLKDILLTCQLCFSGSVSGPRKWQSSRLQTRLWWKAYYKSDSRLMR